MSTSMADALPARFQTPSCASFRSRAKAAARPSRSRSSPQSVRWRGIRSHRASGAATSASARCCRSLRVGNGCTARLNQTHSASHSQAAIGRGVSAVREPDRSSAADDPLRTATAQILRAFTLPGQLVWYRWTDRPHFEHCRTQAAASQELGYATTNLRYHARHKRFATFPKILCWRVRLETGLRERRDHLLSDEWIDPRHLRKVSARKGYGPRRSGIAGRILIGAQCTKPTCRGDCD